MEEIGIRELIREVVGPNTKMERKGEWVMMPCPLAPWRHSGGSDSKPSFGIHIEDEDSSFFHCFTCKSKGPISWFLKLMERYTGEDYQALIKSIDMEETYLAPLPTWDTARAKVKKAVQEPVDETMVYIYEDVDVSHVYLRERGITSRDAVARSGILLDPGDSRGDERILFPVRGPTGILYGFTGRATSPKTDPKVRDYHGLAKEQNLLGIHLIDPKVHKYVVLVEGLFDFLNGLQCGQPTVAVLHSSLTDAQAALLKELGLPVYVFFDNDEAGQNGKRVVNDKLKGHVPVMYVKYPREFRFGDGDPGELYPEEFTEMIENAWLA